MLHVSVPIESTIEMLNFTPVNPLISKCEIKVCWVGDQPNRNHSIITKSVAMDMAKSLPGCPIVGFFNKEKEDFESHNRMIDLSNGEFNIIDTTRPYGFVDMNAKVWFQKFMDDGIEREYLMTEGYIWSEVYPESKRIVEKGNNQSMELNKKFTNGTWTKDDNGSPRFFIVNEAIIEKLCILGENVEPCFEGAGFATKFSLDGNWKEQLYAMVEDLKYALQEGGNIQMPENKDEILEIIEPIEDTEFKKKPEEEENSQDKEDSDIQEKTEDSEREDEDDKKKGKLNHSAEERCPDCGKPVEECECNKEKEHKYELTEIPEYVELQEKFSLLQANYDALAKEIAPLREFKAKAEKEAKQSMIDSFYMLSNEDKQDVIANIDTYSLDDIEAKLSIICVRNKVSFSLDDDKEIKEQPQMVYSLDVNENDDSAPAWIKAVRDTAKTMY